MELPKASEITALSGLLAPGLIILGIRNRFRVGSKTDLKDNLIAYAVASVAYYAAAYPIFHADGGVRLASWLWQLLQFFIAPVFVGVFAAYLDQSELFYKVANRLRLKSSHHIPAAWDYAFSSLRRGTYVLVKLSDGTLYAGLMGKESFASSATEERDLLIQEVFTIQDGKPWTLAEPRRSVLLCGKDIRWIEFITRS